MTASLLAENTSPMKEQQMALFAYFTEAAALI